MMMTPWTSLTLLTFSALDGQDIKGWLINQEARPGKLKCLLKTHKPGEVFSVCLQPVEKLSSFIQHLYLGPIVNSGVLKWRLKDTQDFITFIHNVNTFISANNITSPPIICSIDIKNMFPSLFKDLALPAIKQRLLGHDFLTDESNAVVSALEIVRDGTRVLWRDEVVRQKDRCSLGPSDSCDYADITLDAFLQVLVPRLECQLKVDLSFLRFYRDDGFMERKDCSRHSKYLE
jgi:hypothetical protein